jgi:hypothetical protein
MYFCVFLTKVEKLQDFIHRLFDTQRNTRYHFCENMYQIETIENDHYQAN